MEYRSDLKFINPLDIRDKNGNIQLSFPLPTGNADNYLTVLNGASGEGGQYKGVGFGSEGASGDIDMYFNPKGSGIARIYSSSATSYRELIANIDNAIATVGYVERAVTVGVVYLQHVVAVFDNASAALPTATNGVIIDGNPVATGERVLVKASNDTNDTWIVTNTATGWVKVEDFLDETNPGSSEPHYRVGATTFVDNDGTSPTYKDVRFTWNGTEWVLQYSSSELPYDATEGVKLTNFTFSMDIPALDLLTTLDGEDLVAVYDADGFKHKRVKWSDLIPPPTEYKWVIDSNSASPSNVENNGTVKLLKETTDNWVETEHSTTTGDTSVYFKYGGDRNKRRIIMTNDDATAKPIEEAGASGKILRPYHTSTSWGSGANAQFIQSTNLPLGDGITKGVLALYNTESSEHYVAFEAAATMSSNTTYKWPTAYPSSNGYILASSSTGQLSWVERGLSEDKYVGATATGTPGFLDAVLVGIAGDSNPSGISISALNVHELILRGTVSDCERKTLNQLNGDDYIAIYEAVGTDQFIKEKSTIDTISSYYLNTYYNSSNNYYNGSIAVINKLGSEFSLNGTTGNYDLTLVISSELGIANYDSDWILPIVQRQFTDGTDDVYETIQCDTKVRKDSSNGDKGTIIVSFSNQPSSTDKFRITLILDPTLVTQPA